MNCYRHNLPWQERTRRSTWKKAPNHATAGQTCQGPHWSLSDERWDHPGNRLDLGVALQLDREGRHEDLDIELQGTSRPLHLSQRQRPDGRRARSRQERGAIDPAQPVEWASLGSPSRARGFPSLTRLPWPRLP